MNPTYGGRVHELFDFDDHNGLADKLILDPATGLVISGDYGRDH